MNFLSFIKSRSIGIICLLSFIAAFSYNEINLSKAPKEQIRAGETIKTSDDDSYLVPAKNFLNSGIWKSDAIGMQAHFVRPPGYGILYLAILKISSSTKSLFLLKLIQYLLFSCSVYWLYSISKSLSKDHNLALITAAIYGLSPLASGFLSYTLTEGITPALLLLFIFLLIKAYNRQTIKQKNILYLLASLCFSYLLIVRPQLGFTGLLLPIFVIKDIYHKNFLKRITALLLYGTISISALFIWQVRNYNLTNSFTGLHSIYYPDNNSIYRPTFKAFWNFVGCWAQEGETAHSYMVPLWNAGTKGDTSDIYIENALKTFPEKVIQLYGKERLHQVFKDYQVSIIHQKNYLDQNLAIPLSTPEIELQVINEFDQLTAMYKSAFWIDYHIKSPLKVFRTMVFHSNLSLYMFQHTYRGNWPMETVRVLFYALHSLCFLGIILSLFFWKSTNWKQTSITLTTLLYIAFLCYYQRGIEERYTLPILPLLMIGLTTNLKYFYDTLRIKIQSRR